MSEEANVQVKLFGLLHSLRSREGKPTVVSVAVPDEGVPAGQIAEDLGLPLEKIEGVFCGHIVRTLDYVIQPGDSIAFVPSGTPGPHRFTLGLYRAGRR